MTASRRHAVAAGRDGARAEPRRRRRAAALACILAAHAGGAAAAAADTAMAAIADLSRLSLEELAQIEVSSVSKRPERLADAAAAVYVITREDIRRAGASTLAEALRLAPNLQVARSSSHTYAISARGFNSTSANKLLVMIDDRSVYTPLHSGVFWDVQDVVLADVERIEVVSGPGGSLWGANAVNGIINVITRSARDTEGSLVHAAAGTQERLLALRQGLRTGDAASMRLHAKVLDVDNTVRADGSEVGDDWKHRQLGFRADGGPAASAWTLQGDVYEGMARVPGSPERDVAGANLLGRWDRELGGGSALQVQAYIDRYERTQPGFFTEQLLTYDLEAQHRVAWGRHELVWGGGYREQRDETTGGALFAFMPADRRLRLANLFAQHTLSLNPRTRLTLGLRAERNDYTGVELQPNVRLAWKTPGEALLWGAISRAVRTPSRLDRDFFVFVDLSPPYSGPLMGGPEFTSERVTAYELGYRGRPSAKTSFSASIFYNDYDRLRSVEPDGAGAFVLGNEIEGRSVGLEAWGSMQVNEAWRLAAGVNLLRQRLRFTPQSADPGAASAGGNDPRWQLSLRSSHTLTERLALDVGLRAVAELPAPPVPRYAALDARLAWTLRPGFEVSVSGHNLLDDSHPEFGSPPGRSEVRRSLSLRALWQL